MKYLTIKHTRSITIRYGIFISLLWVILVFLREGEVINIEIPFSPSSFDIKIVKPHIVGIGFLLLAVLMVSHALAYKVSRWVNNGKGTLLSAFRALFISWTLVSFILLFIFSEFKLTNYVLVVSLLPLLLSVTMGWELKRASRIK